MPKPRTLLTLVVAFLLVFVPLSAYAERQAGQQQPHAAPQAPICSAACHAAGLAQLGRQIDAQAAQFEAGRKCWPAGHAPAGLIPRTVIVKGFALRTGQAWRLTFDQAWAANHNPSSADDVWLLAVCK